MDKGIFYSVGVGPGDPELLTLKALRIIKSCDVIISPDSGGRETLAHDIVREHLAGKRIEMCPMPMLRDKEELRKYHDSAAARIASFLDEGLSAVFLTLGDPSIYSTAMYVHKRLAALGYTTRIIPGVPSFCAAAASLDTALCEGGEPLHIIPASYGGDYSQLGGTKVLMKSGKETARLMSEFKNSHTENVYMVRRASMENEAVFRTADEFDGNEDYFSVIVVKSV